MKTIFCLSLLFVTAFSFSQAVFSPELSFYLLNNKNTAEFTEINVFFSNEQSLDELAMQLDEQHSDFDTRIKSVVSLLKNNAEKSLSEFYDEIDFREIDIERDIRKLNTFWGVNMINIEIRTSLIYRISDIDNVRYIDMNSPRYRISETSEPIIANGKSLGGAEPGLETINAHRLWELGYTGRNILFLSMDTGVNPDHPAIDDNFAGNHYPMDQCWYGVRSELPADHASSSHGTHTTGTVLGLDRETYDTIGVAWNAMWIATDPVATSDSELLDPTDFMTVFQWVLDPDGNPETTDDVPKVINNSWGYDYSLAAQFGACEMVEAEIFIAIETAGICSPFSVGNDGPGESTTGFPAMRAFNLVNPMAIGALQPGGTAIASFSSRGPTPCVSEPGSLQIKPEVSAPGVNVRSCIGSNEYGLLSGTSMACPHVSGALLLLAEAFPMASAYELKYALYNTAIDLGEVGEDNIFGNGLIDVFEAYNYLALTYIPEPPVSNEYDLSCEIIQPENTIICPEDRIFSSQIRIANEGVESLNQINLQIYLNDLIIVDSLLEITLDQGQEFVFETDSYEFENGHNHLHSVVSTIANYREYDRFDNADIVDYYVIQEEDFPYNTEFADELSESNWLIQNPDNLATWENLAWGIDLQFNALGLNFGTYGTRNWEVDYANLPIIELPDSEPLYFSFTYAYKKRVEYLYKDSVVVELSTDCGLSFPYELWRNGGEDMATVEGNSSLTSFVPETRADFDTVDISLDQFKNQEVLIRFRSVNDRGSVVYFDYVRVGQTLINEIESIVKKSNLKVYPNPANNYITVEIDNCSQDEFIEVYNSSGKLIKVVKIQSGQKLLDISELSSGIYFIRLRNSILSSKFIVN
jgi:bacillopeptidase F